MSKTKTTYRVTLPDGTTETRKSHRVYTHAVACYFEPWNAPGTRQWGVRGFCGSLVLAQRLVAKPRLPGDVMQIVEVTVQ